MSKLNFLNGWGKVSGYFTRRSAQSYMGANQLAFATTGCGSSCGSDDEKPQPAGCGAADDSKPQPAGCGAADDNKPASACGSGCGAGEGK